MTYGKHFSDVPSVVMNGSVRRILPIVVHVLMRDERSKEERSKQGQANNKAKQHSTPKAVTFPKKNEWLGWDSKPRHSTLLTECSTTELQCTCVYIDINTIMCSLSRFVVKCSVTEWVGRFVWVYRNVLGSVGGNLMANGSQSNSGNLHLLWTITLLCTLHYYLVNIICMKRLFVVFEGFRSGPAG